MPTSGTSAAPSSPSPSSAPSPPGASPAAPTACGPGGVSGKVVQWASSAKGGGGAYALVLLDRSAGCSLSTLATLRVKDSGGSTVAKQTGIAMPMSIAVALWIDFISICPTVRTQPLALQLDFGNGVVAKVGLPDGLVVTCADGSSRAFVDGVVEATAPLPSPGGTCSANDFAVGVARSNYAMSTAVSRALDIDQPLRNTGPDCVLRLPSIVAVAAASGPFQPVSAWPVADAPTFTVRSGASVSLWLRAWWLDEPSPTDAPSVPVCRQALQDVTRLEFPMASGYVEIDWGIPVAEACSAPTMLSLDYSIP
jgi:hypothetical protein